MKLRIDEQKRPIVIFSAPRSGSTSLGSYLKQITGLPYIIEPDHHGPAAIKKFIDFASTTNKFIVKMHYSVVSSYSPLDKYFLTSPDVFRIRLRRRSILKQAASHYIAETRNKLRGYEIWNTLPGNINVLQSETGEIPIDEKKLEFYLIRTYRWDRALAESTVDFNLNLFYEDITHLFDQTKIQEYIKPSNYEEVLETLKKISNRLRSKKSS